jgi:peptidoglycan/LPS O-acetylase OafA/YrhL
MHINRNNNFDIIRLLTAAQVMWWHGASQLEIMTQLLPYIYYLHQFPGVPIFFAISGFLISYSLERSNFNIRKYIKNRSLRIYPALWLCTFFTLALLIIFSVNFSIKDILIWLVAQLTFFQFFAGESLKSWGVGHPNGSLWSISVELQFYFILPCILYFIRNVAELWKKNIFLISLFVFTVLFEHYFQAYLVQKNNTLLMNLWGVSIFHYLHFFMVGIIIYVNFEFLKEYLAGKALLWFVIYVIYFGLISEKFHLYFDPFETNIWGVIAYILLSFFIISAAFSTKFVPQNLLNHNDISYGIYIYHMLVVNSMVSLGMTGKVSYWFLLSFFTILVALFSWFVIEKRALKMK